MKKIVFLFHILVVILLSSCNKTETLDSVQSNYIAMDSIQIHYKVHGEGDNSLVFVHGWACDLKVWSNQFDYFKDKYQLVFIDLPGFGESDKPKIDYTLDLFAKSVQVLIDDLQIDQATLIGHSLGFPVCKEFVKQYDKNRSKLCNVDGVILHFPTDSIERVNYSNEMNGFVSMFAGDGYKDNVLGFVNGFIKEQTPENVKEYMLSTMTQTPQYVGSSTMTNLVHEKYWTDEVSETSILSVYAENEELPEDHVEYLKFLFPNTTYYEMEGVGHFLMMEKPEEFNKMLENFLINNKQ